MLTVIIPIDFSGTSVNAAKYLAHLSKEVKVKKVVLFHTHFYDLQITEESKEHLTEKVSYELNEIKNQLLQIQPEMDIDIHITGGNMFYDIENLAVNIDADLIVMGLTGKNAMSQKLIGSNTLNIAHDAQCPVLIISENTRYKEVEKIAYAIQFKDSMEKDIPVEIIEYFTKALNAELTLLNVDKHHANYEKIKSNIVSVRNIFQNIDAKLVTLDGTNIADVIEEYIDEEDVDLLITVAYKHGFFHNLFQGSTTKKIIFQSDIPVLVLRPNA